VQGKRRKLDSAAPPPQQQPQQPDPPAAATDEQHAESEPCTPRFGRPVVGDAQQHPSPSPSFSFLDRLSPSALWSGGFRSARTSAFNAVASTPQRLTAAELDALLPAGGTAAGASPDFSLRRLLDQELGPAPPSVTKPTSASARSELLSALQDEHYEDPLVLAAAPVTAASVVPVAAAQPLPALTPVVVDALPPAPPLFVPQPQPHFDPKHLIAQVYASSAYTSILDAPSDLLQRSGCLAQTTNVFMYRLPEAEVGAFFGGAFFVLCKPGRP